MKFFRNILPILALTLYLGIFDGKIALFRKDYSVPVQVFPFPVSAFPLQDQAALETGIPIRDQEHLSELLEAYLS